MNAGGSVSTRALGYVRVSTGEQAASGHGLAAQEATVRAEAARRGWAIEIVADAGGSGRHVNPGLRSCLEQLATGRADALVTAKMDRLARSVSHASQHLEAARTQGWDLVICDVSLDLSSPQGKAMASMLATFAELERDLLSIRTREGLSAAKAKGVRIGAPRLAPAAIVHRICTDRDAGQSFGSIARALTDEGVLSPAGRATWQASTVRRIYLATSKESA